jgi:hypothetical protein
VYHVLLGCHTLLIVPSLSSSSSTLAVVVFATMVSIFIYQSTLISYVANAILMLFLLPTYSSISISKVSHDAFGSFVFVDHSSFFWRPCGKLGQVLHLQLLFTLHHRSRSPSWQLIAPSIFNGLQILFFANVYGVRTTHLVERFVVEM